MRNRLLAASAILAFATVIMIPRVSVHAAVDMTADNQAPFCGAKGADPWIGNEVIGMNITEFGSDIGTTVLQYPMGTAQGYLETYWLRYDGGGYYGNWPWEVPDAVQVVSVTPMEYTENSDVKKEAYGAVAAGLLNIEMVATCEAGKSWVRIVYTIANNNNFPVENIRFYQFADIDVGESPCGGAIPESVDDSTWFDSELNTVYVIDHVDNTPDAEAELETDPELRLLGIMSPVQVDHHDVYGGPVPEWPRPYANPAYYHLEADTLNDQDYFYGDGAMTMEWTIGTLGPNETVSIPVYFLGAIERKDITNVVPVPVVVTRDITVQLDASGNVSITADQVDNGSSASAGIASMTVAPSAFTAANVGTNTVTLTVIDMNTNAASRTAIVIVEDKTPPTVRTRNITVQLDVNGKASITAAQVDNGSWDACGIASMTVVTNAFTIASVGANTVTLTVKDVNGNVASATATVTVLGSQDLKQQALAQLIAMRDTACEKDARKIGKAITKVTRSLEAKLWATKCTLTKYGNKVFDREGEAVEHLRHVAGAAVVIDMLVTVDQSLAQIAINMALEADGADAKKILAANNEMAKAAGELARGKAHQAIEHYKHAWHKAMESMRKDIDLEPVDCKVKVLVELKALLLTTPRADACRIADACNRISAGLDPDLWTSMYSVSRNGGKVFDNDRAAVDQLSKVTTVSAAGLIISLAGSDAEQAQAAIDEAVDADGDAARIAEARQKMIEAAALMAQGRIADAIGKHKDAWQKAVDALK